MLTWEEIEKNALMFIQKEIDRGAILIGGSNSYSSDILLPNSNFIEVKKIPAAAFGQFTESTIDNNPFSNKILSTFLNSNSDNKIYLDNLGKDWVEYHYRQKNVSHFLLFDSSFKLVTIEDFIKDNTFYCTGRAKASGSSKCPKKYYEQLTNILDLEIKNDRIYAKDNNLFGSYIEIDKVRFFVSKKNKGEIRKCSEIKNFTILLNIEH